MSSQSRNAKTYITELQRAIQAASWNYEIWWVYKSRDTRPKYLDTMNHYNLFFRNSIHAHFVAMVLALYALYETRRDTHNIPGLLEIVAKDGRLPEATLATLRDMREKAKPIWIKVCIIRNEVVAHYTNQRALSEAFKNASITYDEFSQLAELTKDFLNTLTFAWNDSTHAFNLNPRNDTLRLLDDLKVLRQSRDGSRGNMP